VADAYFEVKNALVNSDVTAAKKGVENMKSTLTRVEMRSLKGQAHDHWMALQEQLSSDLDMIANASELEPIRQHFSMLSANILEMTESFGLEKDKVYKDFCPMAFNNEGAYWLSETEEIRNPYFGEEMLTCGEVKETYRKGSRVFEKEKRQQQQPSGAHIH
jgi:Cu(I)/Ag(I) efflux system membrane fusion protein